MTAPKTTMRRRRSKSTSNIPVDLVAWFSGKPRREDQSSIPWSALAYPDHVVLPERWAAWKAENPGASPPAGFEWLDDPTSKRHPSAWLLEEARKVIARRA